MNYKLPRAIAFLFGIFAIVAFGDWWVGGVEYLGDERVSSSHPGTLAIVLTICAIFFYFLADDRRQDSDQG